MLFRIYRENPIKSPPLQQVEIAAEEWRGALSQNSTNIQDGDGEVFRPDSQQVHVYWHMHFLRRLLALVCGQTH